MDQGVIGHCNVRRGRSSEPRFSESVDGKRELQSGQVILNIMSTEASRIHIESGKAACLRKM